MSQIEVPKSVAYVTTGAAADEATVAKVVAYYVVRPGEGPAGGVGQSHCHVQIIRRPRR